MKRQLPYLKSAPSNLPKSKGWCKIAILKFGTKNIWFEYFWAGSWKQYCHIWNQYSRIFLIEKFCEETKMPKFWTKNVLFGYFWAGISKQYCHIWNQHLQICLIAKFYEIMKMAKFGSKKEWIGYFWAGIWKQCCNSWNQHPRICLTAKLYEKIEMLKIGIKNTLFGILGLKFFKNYCHILNQHPQISLFTKSCKKNPPKWFILVFLGWNLKKILSCLNQHDWVCPIAKCGSKIKILNFETKNAWFGYFWARILKGYCHIWNQHTQIGLTAKFCEAKQKCLNLGPKMPRICKKWVFNSYNKFCYRVGFF